jgi:hypothetical protein
MKTMRVMLAVLFGAIFGFAATPENDTSKNVNWTKAELNYEAGLQSDNNGVKVSAANYIRKYNLVGALEELKTLLAAKNTEHVKMAGALALISIGGNEGRTAILNALQTEENEVVAEFYKLILSKQSIAQN